MRVLMILMAVAGPVAAQDLVYSNDASRDCARGQSDLSRQIGCIGASANLCMERTPGGGSTVGMAGCLGAELNYWDNRLNRTYQRVVTQEKAAGLEAGLREMQRAWVSYRDTRCAYETSIWGNGTGASTAFAFCMMQVTGEQALYLRSMQR